MPCNSCNWISTLTRCENCGQLVKGAAVNVAKIRETKKMSGDGLKTRYKGRGRHQGKLLPNVQLHQDGTSWA